MLDQLDDNGITEDSARAKWKDDGTFSIVEITDLQLEEEDYDSRGNKKFQI